MGCPVDGASEEEAAAALVGAIYRGSWVVIGSAWVWIWFCFCFASPAVSAPDFLQLVVVLFYFLCVREMFLALGSQ